MKHRPEYIAATQDQAEQSETVIVEPFFTRRQQAMILSAVSLLIPAVIGYADKDVAADSLHSLAAGTAQEQLIADGYDQAFGERPGVLCLTQDEIQARLGKPRDDLIQNPALTTQETFTGKPVSIIMNDRLCDAIADFANNPDERENPSAAEVQALRIATHEMRHYKTDAIISESGADCGSVQTLVPFAEAFGATPEQAIRVRQRSVGQFGIPSTEVADSMRSYVIGTECRQDGAEDMHLPGDAFPPAGSVGGDVPTTQSTDAGLRLVN